MGKRLFVFGMGYSALVLARQLLAEGWSVAGTCQGVERKRELAALGIEAWVMDARRPLRDPPRILASATHVLSSIPPNADGDPVAGRYDDVITALEGLQWVGYLSTAGVYGDAGGGAVDEYSPRRPTGSRGQRRVRAEDAWLGLWAEHGAPVHLFRLAGIYGPGRSALDRVRDGTARQIVKFGHRFSRIHVDDIAGVLRASMARPNPGAAYNVCDDEPAMPASVTAFACQLLGVEPPPLEPFEEAAGTMSPMALSFWRDNRVLVNRRLHEELGYDLKYPTYREGLQAVLEAGG